MDKEKLLIGVSILALVIVGALCVWKVAPLADAEPVPSPETSASVPEGAVVTLDSGTKSGTVTQEVTVGENVAAITVHFNYDLQGDGKVVTDIVSATAEKRAGWHYVERTATIDQDKIIYGNEGAQVVVPVIYQASIGAGYANYDHAVVIDLSEA